MKFPLSRAHENVAPDERINPGRDWKNPETALAPDTSHHDALTTLSRVAREGQPAVKVKFGEPAFRRRRLWMSGKASPRAKGAENDGGLSWHANQPRTPAISRGLPACTGEPWPLLTPRGRGSLRGGHAER